MTRQLTSTNRQPLLRSPHAQRPPRGRLRSSWQVFIELNAGRDFDWRRRADPSATVAFSRELAKPALTAS
jgi:hypothetical protein